MNPFITLITALGVLALLILLGTGMARARQAEASQAQALMMQERAISAREARLVDAQDDDRLRSRVEALLATPEGRRWLASQLERGAPGAIDTPSDTVAPAVGEAVAPRRNRLEGIPLLSDLFAARVAAQENVPPIDDGIPATDELLPPVSESGERRPVTNEDLQREITELRREVRALIRLASRRATTEVVPQASGSDR